MRGIAFRAVKAPAVERAQALAALFRDRQLRGGPLPGPKAPATNPVVFCEDAWTELLAGSRARLDREQVGVLFGHFLKGGGLHVVRAPHAVDAPASAVHAELDAAAWERLHATLGARAQSLDVVGWWHTHPDLGAFFSSTDRTTQNRAFAAPGSLGLVIDPVRHEWAAFEGPNSKARAFAPLLLSARDARGPDLPAHALLIGLDPAAPDLRTALWDVLAEAPRGLSVALAATAPTPFRPTGPCLVLDRPLLRRRLGPAGQALRRLGPGGPAARLALALRPADVVGVWAHGTLHAPGPFLAGDLRP